MIPHNHKLNELELQLAALRLSLIPDAQTLENQKILHKYMGMALRKVEEYEQRGLTAEHIMQAMPGWHYLLPPQFRWPESKLSTCLYGYY